MQTFLGQTLATKYWKYWLCKGIGVSSYITACTSKIARTNMYANKYSHEVRSLQKYSCKQTKSNKITCIDINRKLSKKELWIASKQNCLSNCCSVCDILGTSKITENSHWSPTENSQTLKTRNQAYIVDKCRRWQPYPVFSDNSASPTPLWLNFTM